MALMVPQHTPQPLPLTVDDPHPLSGRPRDLDVVHKARPGGAVLHVVADPEGVEFREGTRHRGVGGLGRRDFFVALVTHACVTPPL